MVSHAPKSSNPLLQVLSQHVQNRGDSRFLTHLDSGKIVSYHEVMALAETLALLLDDHKVVKKSRVAFVIRNHWMVYPLLVACSARRATLVPIDPDLHRDELSFILEDCAPSLTIALAGVELPKYSGQKPSLPLEDVLKFIASNPKSLPLDAGEADDVNLMIYTSGTTGTNKCVTLTSGNLLSNAKALAARYEVLPSDRFWCTLPTHHMNALMITGLVPLVAGASVYLSDILSFKNAKLFWQNMADHQITICSLVPSIMALLLKIFPKGKDVEGSKIRFGFCGAAPLSAPTWMDFEDVFSLPIYQGYGLTETTCWAASIPIHGDRKYETVGIPLDCATIKIDTSDIGQKETFLFGKSVTDEEGQATPLMGPPSGEVLIRGPIVSPGYYKNPKLNKETMTKDGYFKTGDLGFFDEDGFLHITGRLKEIIIKNGANIFSKDIDRILIKHQAVRECKTIGVPDELVGERIYSICVMEEGQHEAELDIKIWLQTQLSQPMWPDVVIFMGYLPAGAAGKVSTNILKKIVTGTLCEEIITSLNRVRYKRAQPSDPKQMSKLVQKALKSGNAISFLAYWGCGTRSDFSDYDRQTLDRLKEYVDGAKRVPQVPPVLTLIFTDTHAHNNQIPIERMNAYFLGIKSYAEKLGMKTLRLSEIWVEFGLTMETIRAELATDVYKEKWQANPLRERLIEQAAKHAEQNQKPEDAAIRYACTTSHEGVIVARKYPDAIFTSYNHPDFDSVSPCLPKVYLSSYKDGTAVKPWFIA